jgi:hypothetical protein
MFTVITLLQINYRKLLICNVFKVFDIHGLKLKKIKDCISIKTLKRVLYMLGKFFVEQNQLKIRFIFIISFIYEF